VARLRFPRNGDGMESEPATVYVDGFTGALYLDKPHEVERCANAFGSIRAAALDEPAAPARPHRGTGQQGPRRPPARVRARAVAGVRRAGQGHSQYGLTPDAARPGPARPHVRVNSFHASRADAGRAG